jgi:hypothetical protein
MLSQAESTGAMRLIGTTRYVEKEIEEFDVDDVKTVSQKTVSQKTSTERQRVRATQASGNSSRRPWST